MTAAEMQRELEARGVFMYAAKMGAEYVVQFAHSTRSRVVNGKGSDLESAFRDAMRVWDVVEQ